MKKRILYIGNKLSSSNITETTIESLSKKLIGEGYEVISVSSIQNKALRLMDMLRATFIYRKNVDVVLIDTYSTLNFYYAVAVATICRTFRIPYIPILHGGNLPHRLKKSPKLSAKLFSNAQTNIAPSHYLLEAFLSEGFNKVRFIPNTIELKNYPFLLRKKVHPKLLWVRSFSSIYNPTLALQVVEQLQKQEVAVSLCMIGPEKDGSLQRCRQLAEQKNLPVSFTGKLAKEDWIARSQDYDIFINTTHFDNTPVSVIEAMALGLPVISTNVGGIPFLIESNKTGVLVPTDNVDAFVDSILVLLNNPKKANELALQARKTVEQFDWERVKPLWDDVLDF
ncbi:glycosyltransferase family 4 protein [Lutibacter sp.]